MGIRKLQWAGFKGLVKQDIFSQLLSNCGDAKDLIQGRKLHQEILSGEHRSNWFLHNLLVQMYGRCGSLEESQAAFDAISHPNVFSWNSLLASYAQNGHSDEAKQIFDTMQLRNLVSWSLLLQALSQRDSLGSLDLAFARVPVRTLVSCNVVISAYAQRGDLNSAQRVFDGMLEHDLVSWTSMIQAYSQAMRIDKAKMMFDLMPVRDEVSWNSVIATYARAGYLEETQRIFDRAPCCSVVPWNSLLVAYGFREVERLEKLFESMPERNGVSWTTLLHSYSLCAYDGFLKRSADTFVRIPQHGLVSCTTMMMAYAQAGHFQEASDLFAVMPERDVLAWNVVISAGTQFGRCDGVLEIFRDMCLDGTSPNEVTFTSVLICCSCCGFLERCIDCFVSMQDHHFVTATHEHFSCMVDMFGRLGRVDVAEDLIASMPFWPEVSAWGALLNACNIHQHLCCGFRATMQAIVLDPTDSFPYLLLANSYTKAMKL